MQPTPDEIRAQLDRILASEPFANGGRLSRFLRYVVERTLSGEGDRLKEYVIGTEVFDRGDGYDPRLDSIVRVEAGRLRTKLDEYYNRLGRDDAVVVQIPRGGYAPLFERRGTPAPGRARVHMRAAVGAAVLLLAGAIGWAATRWTPADPRPSRLSIAVLPFKSYTTDDAAALLTARLTDRVTSELAREGTLAVVSHTSALQFEGVRRPLKEIAQSLGADIVMEASVTADGPRIKVDARLVDAALDRKIWVETFATDTAHLDELPPRIAEAASAAVATWSSSSSPAAR